MTLGNLPLEVSSFVGRAADLERIPALLEQCRLVTITGPGGIGKTRLAVRVAASMRNVYADRVWFTDLSLALDRASVRRAVGNFRAFDTRPQLIVLDNCEHVLEAAAELCRSVLECCPNVFLLATSREVLGLPGEVVWPAPLLSLPREYETCVHRLQQSEAARLLLERSAAALPGYTLADQEVAHVAEICRRLEGVPLALEFAAARVRSLGMAELASLLRDQAPLLNLGARHPIGPSRQHSLRASLEWSFRLLADSERVLLRRLASFEDGWTLREAQAVHSRGYLSADLVSVALDALVAKSLVYVERCGAGVRYRVLESLRQYTLEQPDASVEPARPPQTPLRSLRAPLSPRELEVLSLVARGCSNKEIGTELTIAEATARVHVEHILTKLDLRSRTQAAVWALQREPTPRTPISLNHAARNGSRSRRQMAGVRPPLGSLFTVTHSV
jgi:predicted ATPase/DNA-binding CsgD family transcriptional regulator